MITIQKNPYLDAIQNFITLATTDNNVGVQDYLLDKYKFHSYLSENLSYHQLRLSSTPLAPYLSYEEDLYIVLCSLDGSISLYQREDVIGKTVATTLEGEIYHYTFTEQQSKFSSLHASKLTKILRIVPTNLTVLHCNNDYHRQHSANICALINHLSKAIIYGEDLQQLYEWFDELIHLFGKELLTSLNVFRIQSSDKAARAGSLVTTSRQRDQHHNQGINDNTLYIIDFFHFNHYGPREEVGKFSCIVSLLNNKNRKKEFSGEDLIVIEKEAVLGFLNEYYKLLSYNQ